MIGCRYLAILADNSDALLELNRDSLTRLGYVVRSETATAVIATVRESDFCPLETGEGAFIGTVFPSAPGARLYSIPRSLSNAIIDTKGRYALSALWGSYVLIAENAHHGNRLILRDPTGALPCVFVRGPHITVIGSSVADIMSYRQISARVDQESVIEHLVLPDIPRQRTCLDGVLEVLPGFVLEGRGEGLQTSQAWLAKSVVDKRQFSTRQDAIDELDTAIERSVVGYANSFTTVAVSLSGGLDSSLVASMLPATSRRYAYNFAGADPDSDERRYARLVAKQLQIELAELPLEPNRVDLLTPTLPDWPRPLGRANVKLHHLALAEMTEQLGVEAHFTGLGGDQAFCAFRSALPLVDRLRRLRTNASALTVLRDTAELAHVDKLSVALQAVRIGIFGRRANRASGLQHYLSRDARIHLDSIRGRDEPFELDMLPGRAFHSEVVARLGPCRYDTSALGLPVTIAPLISQPVVETCLQIPSWEWVFNARDRSVARDVAARHVPLEVAYRTSKSGPDILARELCMQNREILHEYICNGTLASAGFLDRAAVARALSYEELVKKNVYTDLLTLLETEMWISHWS